MSPFAEACHRPFSNGTEGDAWTRAWCDYCTRDHGLHNGGEKEPMCDLMGAAMFGDVWPEAWIPEPDDGRVFLPSRMICTAFTPCTETGCTGDPGAGDRAERVTEVVAYWADRR